MCLKPTVEDEAGSCRNNIIQLSSEDCNVFAALATDDYANDHQTHYESINISGFTLLHCCIYITHHLSVINE